MHGVAARASRVVGLPAPVNRRGRPVPARGPPPAWRPAAAIDKLARLSNDRSVTVDDIESLARTINPDAPATLRYGFMGAFGNTRTHPYPTVREACAELFCWASDPHDLNLCLTIDGCGKLERADACASHESRSRQA